jgi:hypothetical protein
MRPGYTGAGSLLIPKTEVYCEEITNEHKRKNGHHNRGC